MQGGMPCFDSDFSNVCIQQVFENVAACSSFNYSWKSGAAVVLGLTRYLMLQWLRTADLSEQDLAPGTPAGKPLGKITVVAARASAPTPCSHDRRYAFTWHRYMTGRFMKSL